MSTKRVVAIIQARMSSSRLPGKTMLPICGTPMIGVLLSRLRKSETLTDIVVATSTDPSDDVLCDYLTNEVDTKVFRGSLNDLLDRYYNCAVLYNAEIIVRITADDPLKDPEIVDYAVRDFVNSPSVDYVSNCLTATFPEGLDVEVFSFRALEVAYDHAQLASEREHLTPYITNHPELFNLKNFECYENFSDWRWTVDKPNDYIFVVKIFENFYQEKGFQFSYRDAIQFIKDNPSLIDINKGTIRFEGYLKSVKQDGM